MVGTAPALVKGVSKERFFGESLRLARIAVPPPSLPGRAGVDFLLDEPGFSAPKSARHPPFFSSIANFKCRTRSSDGHLVEDIAHWK